MLKHLSSFIHNHIDTLEVLGVTGTGLGTLFMNIELGLKILVTIGTLGYLFWKWRIEYLKNKKEQQKND